jgi:hypothetical protein
MSSVSNGDIVNLTKKVYGDLTNLLPQDQHLERDIPFSEKQKVGDKYVEAVVLTAETGITLGGSAMDAFELNPAIAGAVKQAEVSPYISVLGSVVPWGLISRTAGGGEKAFYDGTKHIFKNNLKSHGKFLEIMRLYGQADSLLGYVSYATATYRGVAFTNGGGALSVNGTSVTFTAGVNTSSKHILLAPGQFAAGIWVGMEGVKVQQVNSSGTVVAEGKLVSVDSEKGVIEVDFTPVAASSTTSHRLCFEGMGDAKEMVGVQKILGTSGTLFGINNTRYRLYRGNTASVGGKLSFTGATGVGKYVANMVNAGGLEGDLDFYINPRSWETLNADQAALRDYDSSYKSNEASNGFEDIVYHTQTGKLTFKAHRICKEGDAFGLHLPSWSRSGSAEVSFTVPGMNKEIIFPLENQAAWAFRSYADQYVFCHEPAKNVYLSGINDEA